MTPQWGEEGLQEEEEPKDVCERVCDDPTAAAPPAGNKSGNEAETTSDRVTFIIITFIISTTSTNQKAGPRLKPQAELQQAELQQAELQRTSVSFFSLKTRELKPDDLELFPEGHLLQPFSESNVFSAENKTSFSVFLTPKFS